MAKSVQIEAFRFPATSPMLRVEAMWWDCDKLIKDCRFIHSNETGSYSDWTAELTFGEFIQLNLRFQKQDQQSGLGQLLYNSSVQSLIDGVIEYLNHETDHFRVTAFEWESGY